MAESKSSRLAHDAVVRLLRDHGRRPPVLGVDVVEQVVDHGRPLLLGLLVEVGHGDARREDGIVGVGDRHVGGRLGSLLCRSLAGAGGGVASLGSGGEGGTYKVVKLYRRDAAVHAGDDLLGYGHGVDVVHVQAVAQPRDARRDLVELDALLAPIWQKTTVSQCRGAEDGRGQEGEGIHTALTDIHHGRDSMSA